MIDDNHTLLYIWLWMIYFMIYNGNLDSDDYSKAVQAVKFLDQDTVYVCTFIYR